MRRHRYSQPFDPRRRELLLGHALDFTREASRLAGVLRIALLGSITTPKAQPKDIDLLVTISDEVDVATLAALGRRLRGRTGAQSPASGADIFLANTQLEYIGRICQYRECWRRADCEARTCGFRGHINTDLDALTLSRELIAAPPIEIWPHAYARVPIPPDVQQQLLDPLAAPT